MTATTLWCPHQPPCPDLAAPDSGDAAPIMTEPRTGARLLCNGVLEPGPSASGRTVVALHQPSEAFSAWFADHARAFRGALEHLTECAGCRSDDVCPVGDELIGRLETLQTQRDRYGAWGAQRREDYAAA
jgi:hypothetical protein